MFPFLIIIFPLWPYIENVHSHHVSSQCFMLLVLVRQRKYVLQRSTDLTIQPNYNNASTSPLYSQPNFTVIPINLKLWRQKDSETVALF